MSCIYVYKGQEFETKAELVDFLKASNITPTQLDLSRDVAFKTRRVSAFTTVQEEEATLTLASTISKHAKGEIQNLAKTDFTKIIKGYIENKIKTSKNDVYKARFEEVSNHVPYFVDRVKKFYKSKGVEIVEEYEETEDGNLFVENTLLIDPKQNASAKIRALVSFIPKFTRNAKGTAVEDTDTFLGEPKFVSESAMWNTLKKGLADITNPTFEKMMKVLKEKAKLDYSIEKLREALNKKTLNEETGKLEVDENLRTQFFNVYAINRVEYMSVLLNGEPGSMMARLSVSDPSSQQGILIRTWSENFAFLTSDIVQESKSDRHYYDNEKLQNVIDAFEALESKILKEARKVINLKDATSVRGQNSNKKAEEFKQELLSVMSLAGIELDMSGLNNLLRDDSFKHSKSSLTVHGLNKLFSREGLQFLVDDIKSLHKLGKVRKMAVQEEDTKNPIEDNKIVKLIATKQGEMLEDLAESNTLGAEGNLYSNYSTHTLMSSLVNLWNEDVNNLGDVFKSAYGNGTRVGKWMKRDPKNNKLKLFVLNNLKALGKGDQGDKVSKLSEVELIGAAVNITLSDPKVATYLGLAEADKNRQIAMKGGDFVSSGFTYRAEGENMNEQYTLSNDTAIDVLMGYFADEMFRMRLIWNNLNGVTAIEENQKIAYLHDPKNTYTSYLFPKFSEVNPKTGTMPLEDMGLVKPVKNKDNEIVGYEPVKDFNKEDMSSNRKLRRSIRNSFLQAVAADVQILEESGLIEKNTRTNKRTNVTSTKYESIGIDQKIVRSRYKGNVIDAVADFTLNSIIGSVEVSKLFTGDPASYKSAEKDLFKDLRKRVPAIISGGIKARIYKDQNTGLVAVRPSYTSSVVSNIEHPSDYFFITDSEGVTSPNETLLKYMVEAVNEGKLEGEKKATREDMLELISNYSKVNATDAQAWITIKTAKERLLAFGKWTKEHEDAYKRITARTPKILPKDVKLFLQPLKTVHIEEVSRNGHRYLHYNKQSEAVIIPGLFPDLDAMSKANPEIDHFITLDGKKTGASGVSPINNGRKMLPQEEIKLNYINLSYDRLYLQQDLPTKQIKSTLVGTQLVKNLLGEIVLQGTYEIPLPGGAVKKIQGKKLVEEYHEVVGMLSDLGSESIKQEFGYDMETGTIDQEKFDDFLIKAMEEELTVSDIEALDSNLPIDMIAPLRKKLESKLMAAVAKKTIKLKQLGGAMIQMSSFGTIAETISITDKIKNGIAWIKDDITEGLKPMQLKKDEKTGKLYTEKAQVLLPHKLIVDLVGEKYKSMTSEELKKIISPDVLMGISYRIPNQATASNDLFEIVGILPPEAGDTIISYNEITTKTGSDFDIDKAFIVVPNVEMDKKTGMIRRPKYASEMSPSEAYEEKFKKDWSKSVRAREIIDELEDSYRDKKGAILSKLKELKGNEAVSQALRDNATEIEDVEETLTSNDLIELISRYYDGGLNTEEQREQRTEERTIRDKMLSLKANLKKIDRSVKQTLKAKLLEEGLIPSVEKFKTLSPKERNTKAALENYRLDLMQALLGDPKTYPNAVASLDNETLEKEAKNLYETKGGDENLAFWRGTMQAKTKSLFDKAKNLVGVIANQMTDHKISQAFDLTYRGLNFQIGNPHKSKNESQVSAITDTDGVYTSTWLNLYMNAIVDAAKDPFIVKANINQFTAPVAFMLVRTGVPIKWVNAFIGQPILQKLVNLKSVEEGRFAKAKYDKNGKRLTPEDMLIEEYLKMAKIDMDTYKKISLKNLKTLTENSLKKEINKGNLGMETSLKQLIVLKSFSLFKDTSKELTEAIRVSKADVGNGKDLMQAELREAKLLQVLKNGTIRGIEKKFGATINTETGLVEHFGGFVNLDGSGMSGTFHRNGVQLPAKMFNGQTIMSTNAIKSLLFNTVFDLNPDLINREKSIDAIMNEIYSYIMGIEAANITDGNIRKLFFGKNSTARKLERFKKANPEIVKQNVLLRDMTISYRRKPGDPDFLIFNNKSLDRELYQRAWSDLFETSPVFASELVNYSYAASGFNRNLFSFFQFIPSEEYVNRGVGNFMENAKKVFSETTILEDGKDQIIKHLSENSNVITTVAAKDMTLVSTKTLTNTKAIPARVAFILNNKTDYSIGKNIYDTLETARWLRDGNSNLFQLQGYTPDGPLYIAASKKGFNSKGKIIKEYFTPSQRLSEEESLNEETQRESTIVQKNKMSLLKRETFDPVEQRGTPDVFVPLSDFREQLVEYKSKITLEPTKPVNDPLKTAIITRAERETNFTDKEVQEAKKKCKF